MANQEQLTILKQGVDAWNEWRRNKRNEVFSSIKGRSLLSRLNLSWNPTPEINLMEVALQGANLNGIDLSAMDLRFSNFEMADLSMASLERSNLQGAQLQGANLQGANLFEADLAEADLGGADLQKASLIGARLWNANLSGADLRSADLTGASLIETEVGNALISGSLVYGINVWNLKGEFGAQKDLVVSLPDEPAVTVDNIKIAQFIYLILNNIEIRSVINTLTSKSVLILGRFAIPERKAILDALRNKLREYDLLPIVFDFDRPTDKDFTETIKTLAGLSYFVIADVTNPKSSPLELQATVPDYQIPFVPIIQEGESPFAMMVDLQKKYNWVLNTVSYDSLETLMKVLKPLIIDPAMKKRQELRIIKAQEPEIISGKKYLDKAKE